MTQLATRIHFARKKSPRSLNLAPSCSSARPGSSFSCPLHHSAPSRKNPRGQPPPPAPTVGRDPRQIATSPHLRLHPAPRGAANPSPPDDYPAPSSRCTTRDEITKLTDRLHRARAVWPNRETPHPRSTRRGRRPPAPVADIYPRNLAGRGPSFSIHSRRPATSFPCAATTTMSRGRLRTANKTDMLIGAPHDAPRRERIPTG